MIKWARLITCASYVPTEPTWHSIFTSEQEMYAALRNRYDEDKELTDVDDDRLIAVIEDVHGVYISWDVLCIPLSEIEVLEQ